MDGSRFDAWTRRGFGLAAGGLAGSLLAQTGILDTEAKKKKKKKKCPKCREFAETCSADGKDACCCGLNCRPVDSTGSFCCRAGSTPCSTSGECCSGNCLQGFCICKFNGQACVSNNQCCSFNCTGGMTKTCQAA